jgi:hypothetical protein
LTAQAFLNRLIFALVDWNRGCLVGMSSLEALVEHVTESVTGRKRRIRDMAERGDVEGLQEALDAGADVESRSDYGATALHAV